MSITSTWAQKHDCAICTFFVRMRQFFLILEKIFYAQFIQISDWKTDHFFRQEFEWTKHKMKGKKGK